MRVSFNFGLKPVCFIRASVHKLFQLERSIAVGIHPIRAIINRISLLIYFTSGNKLSLTGPFIRTSKNDMRVDSNKTNPIIFINESSELYLPKESIEPQIKNKIR